jgi:glycosyltransferase involved in cell wall biosynthesis
VATSRHPARGSCSINGVSICEFAISGNSVEGIQGDGQAYQDFLRHSDFDIITNFAAQQWATDLMLPLLHEIQAKKFFVPTGFSALHEPAYASYFESMKDWMKQYDMNIFLSEFNQDYGFAQNAGVLKKSVIPNGASAEEFLSPPECDIRRQLNVPKEQFLILHVGSHTGLKGHYDAIRIFNRTRLTHTTFIIVGNIFSRSCYISCILLELFFRFNPFNLIRGRQLLVRSLPRDQTIALYKTADLFLFPSNIECSPIVLFECMASKTPFLTTDVGNAREIIGWSHAGELLPTIKDKRGYSHADIPQSVKLLEDICRDSGRRVRMQKEGFMAWQNRFRWDKIAQKYEEIYLKTLA